MTGSGVAAPYFPLPPQEYSQAYMAEVIRAFSVYLMHAHNPGEIRATNAVLTTVPTSASGLQTGELWSDSGVMRIAPSGGAAPMFSARAFANFYWDGADIVVRGSGNVASIVRNTTGNYTVTLSTALAAATYAVVANYSDDDTAPTGAGNAGQVIPSDRTTSTFVLLCVDEAGAATDAAGSCNVAIFG